MIILIFLHSLAPVPGAQEEAGHGERNWSSYQVLPPLASEDVSAKSFYLAMRDGVKIAVSLYLPRELKPGIKLPAILHATRYWRASDVRLPSGERRPGVPARARRFLANGYAWVSMDARGTGASEGIWPCPWSPDEVKDYAEVVDWIISQPWSSGRVGAAGISYDGTAAEMVGANGHPAVKAIAPEFSLYDAYNDIGFPGGIHQGVFTEQWAAGNDRLDRNTPRKISRDGKTELLIKGVLPADEDGDGVLLQKIVEARLYNCNVHQAALRVVFKDDLWACDPEIKMTDFSPFAHQEVFKSSEVAVYSYSGWFDGAYQHSAIKRYLTVRNPGSKLILGPWNHGGSFNASPSVQSDTTFDHPAELIRFFDYHLKGIETGVEKEPAVHYYTMGEERWKSAPSWPPESKNLNYYFDSGHLLRDVPPSDREAFDKYQADYSTGTGNQTRWDSLLGGVVVYPDRAGEDKKLLVYTTPPLESAMEVTGHPVVTLYIDSSAADGQFFLYLEDVGTDGKVIYITEGELRALHRKVCLEPQPYRTVVPYHSYLRKDGELLIPGKTAELVFDLLPTSYLFKKGHSVRIALACADKDHFAPPLFPPPLVTVYRDRSRPSHIILPVIER